MLGSKGLLNWISDEQYIKIVFKHSMGYTPDLKNPKTFNEKMQWLKLHDRKPVYSTMVDKYACRGYIADKIGSEYLVPMIGGPWKSADEIDFDSLPEQFVLKCNHDSGGVLVCQDKNKVDVEKIKNFFHKRLARNYYFGAREWPYKEIHPCIFAEKNLGSNLTDYRFYCFNGKAKLIYVYTSSQESDYNRPEPETCDIYDTDWNRVNFRQASPPSNKGAEKPEEFSQMLSLAEKLSADTSFLRVDFYIVDHKVYFSELTLYPGCGLSKFTPPEWDEILGSWLQLPVKGTNE
jgi:hypothetical protein